MTQKQVNEGELKKRIKEDQSAFYILKDDVTNWIDEVKQEFPTFEDCVTNEEHDKRVEEWFVKWFGDSV